MNFPEGLRAEREHARAGQAEALTACIARNVGLFVAGTNSGQPDESFGVVTLPAHRLHRIAAYVGVDCRMTGSVRVAPSGVLARRKAQCRENEAAGVHS